jgi:phage tail sheath protein FI
MTLNRITGAPTSVTAFVSGEAAAQPVRLTSALEVARDFPQATPLRASLDLFFGNGGAEAVIVDRLEVLSDVDSFSLLSFDGEADAPTRDRIAACCRERRALYLVDPPSSWTSAKMALDNLDSLMTRSDSAALYFPRLVTTAGTIAPSAAIAGICARTDAARGVWKAPAGLEAGINGITSLSITLDDRENGELNPLGVNCLRTLLSYGNVVWGARTLAGADALQSEYKYVPVRRMANFLGESIERGTEFAVYLPNDETLWADIRRVVERFLQALFLAGAFAGSKAEESYAVRCDATTMTQGDIGEGFFNIQIAFAPATPGEFVWITIRQKAAPSER